MTDWFQLKNFNEWKNTDMIPPKGEVLVWDVATGTDYKVMFDDKEHCPEKGYSHWRHVLEKPIDPLDIQQVMVGIIEGKKYKRPTWNNKKWVYPAHWLKSADKAKEDYTLSRVDIMATDWIEVKDV